VVVEVMVVVVLLGHVIVVVVVIVVALPAVGPEGMLLAMVVEVPVMGWWCLW